MNKNILEKSKTDSTMAYLHNQFKVSLLDGPNQDMRMLFTSLMSFGERPYEKGEVCNRSKKKIHFTIGACRTSSSEPIRCTRNIKLSTQTGNWRKTSKKCMTSVCNNPSRFMAFIAIQIREPHSSQAAAGQKKEQLKMEITETCFWWKTVRFEQNETHTMESDWFFQQLPLLGNRIRR